MKAYEVHAYIEAGLELRTVDGKTEWVGTREQWRLADDIIDAFERWDIGWNVTSAPKLEVKLTAQCAC